MIKIINFDLWGTRIHIMINFSFFTIIIGQTPNDLSKKKGGQTPNGTNVQHQKDFSPIIQITIIYGEEKKHN